MDGAVVGAVALGALDGAVDSLVDGAVDSLVDGAVDRCLPAVEGASGVASWVPWVPWAVWWAVGIG